LIDLVGSPGSLLRELELSAKDPNMIFTPLLCSPAFCAGAGNFLIE